MWGDVNKIQQAALYNKQKQMIIVVGATGNLGERIVKALLKKEAYVKAIVRENTAPKKINHLKQLGAHVQLIDMANVDELSKAMLGGRCIVSALSGLRDVIIDAQKIVLEAAIKAGVPRFIPSDYSLDFTPFNDGENRNLDWRREFHEHLNKQPIKATSIFNGAFADMLTGQMPLLLFKQKRVLYWGKKNHPMCFTTMDDTATYTAHVALDDHAPRYLRIAGDVKSPEELKQVIEELSSETYKFYRPGGLNLLSGIIKIARFVEPGKEKLYPAWQGMQYMRNMIDDRALINQLDNHRYAEMKWTSAKDVLAPHQAGLHHQK